jgi:hypothetical protein
MTNRLRTRCYEKHTYPRGGLGCQGGSSGMPCSLRIRLRMARSFGSLTLRY